MKTMNLKIGLGLLFIGGLAFLGWQWMFRPAEVSQHQEQLFFGRAVFGPDISDASAVYHFIVKGEDIFVDANKDDIPQPDELNSDRELPLLEDPKNGLTYEVGMSIGISPSAVSESLPQQLALTVKVRGSHNYSQAGSVVLSPDPTETNWLHFGGPLRMWCLDEEAVLLAGSDTATELTVFLATVSEGPASMLGQPGQVAKKPDEFRMSAAAFVIPGPSTPFPELEITYPTESEPLVQEYVLDKFC